MTSIKLEYVNKNMWNGKSYAKRLCLYISARTGRILKRKIVKKIRSQIRDKGTLYKNLY